MKLFLLGMMGSGKSTVGSLLASALHLPFIDLDTYIAAQQKLTIEAIFEQYGEAAFRQMEQLALRECIAASSAFVMASGGGTPCFFDNLEVMKSAGKTIFLQVDLSILAFRLSHNTKHRPLIHNLSVKEIYEKLVSLYTIRLPYYQNADLIVPITATTPAAATYAVWQAVFSLRKL